MILNNEGALWWLPVLQLADRFVLRQMRAKIWAARFAEIAKPEKPSC